MECKTLAEFKILMNALLLENESDKALHILYSIAYFASDNIRTGMFSYLFPNLDELNAVIKLLQRYSLVEFHAEKNEFSVKKDTQTLIKMCLKDIKCHELVLKSVIIVVSASMEYILPSDICHAKSILDHAKEYTTLAEESIILTIRIVRTLNLNRRSSEAYSFGSKAFSSYKNVPLVSQLELQYHLGASLVLGNKHKQALELLMALYEKESEINGKKEISETLKLIAKTMMKMELRFHPSLDSDARLRQIVFGSVPINETKDNAVLCTWIEYANLLITLNLNNKALQILRNVVKRRKKILDAGDDDICEAMEDWAVALAQSNKFPEALETLQNVYDKRKKHLGEMHWKTIQTKYNIALSFVHEEKYSAALPIFEETAAKFETCFGKRHPLTLMARFKAGFIYFQLGDYEKAYEINVDICEKNIEVFGKRSTESFVCKQSIGVILQKQNKTKEALRIFQGLWEEYIGVYGPFADEMIELKNTINHLQQLENKQSISETIHSLSKAGNLEKITTLIQTGVEINVKDEDGKTPLHNAAQFGHVIVAKFLLEKGAKYDINSKAGATPLQLAKSFEMRKLLLTIKGLFEDAKTGNGNQVLQHISEDTCIVNIKDKNGYTALHWAALHGNKAIVKLLLEFEADPTLVSDKWNSPLHIAVSKGHREIVKLLLQSVGRDKLHDFVNFQTETGGNTPLHVSAERGYADVLKILLSYGAVFNIRNKHGKTSLELAEEWSCCNLLKLLEGLFQDAKNGSAEIVCKLRDIDSSELIAVSKARDIEKRTLLQVAVDAKHDGLAKKLLRVLKYNDKN